MTQERQIPNLKINSLTKAQLEEAYEHGLVQPDELWITTDETPASEEWVGENYVKIADIINNVTSTATNKPLSANICKELQDQITNLKQRGRYLSIWNSTTGLAETTPTIDPYEYKAGDYFIVGVTGTTNYRPVGSTYSVSTPSRTVETSAVQVNDTYYYDGTTWTLLHSGGGQVTTTFASLAGSPYDNSNLASALNNKYDASNPDGFQNATQVNSAVSTHNNSTTAHSTLFANKVTKNADIVGATHSKITYDSKGLVTGGSDLALTDLGVTATATELNYVDGVTSNIQTQLNGKATTAQGAKADSAIQGVQVAGTDLTKDANNKVNIPIASSSNLGTIKTSSNVGITGLQINSTSGVLSIACANDGQIVGQSNTAQPIVPANISKAVMEGLGNNSLTWSDAYKTSARKTIGACKVTIEDID